MKNAVATVDGSLLKTTGIIMDSIESGTKSKHGKQKEVLVPQLSYNVNLLMDTVGLYLIACRIFISVKLCI